MRFFLPLLLFAFPLFAFDVMVNGTGITGIWTAYALSTELDKAGLGDQVTLHIVGQWDWKKGEEEANKLEVAAFDHETTAWGPVGLQFQAEEPWNFSDLEAPFKENIGNVNGTYYISPDLCDEGKRVISMFARWHKEHSDTEWKRLQDLLAFNKIAQKEWLNFQSLISPEVKEEMGLRIEGCWAFQKDDLAIKKYIEELEALDSLASGCFDSSELARKLPFYEKQIRERELKGLFLPEDGMVEGSDLRKWLWGQLLEKRGGKPAVILHQGKSVQKLLMEDEVCRGVQFEDGSTLHSDWVILATGYGTKALVKELGIDLPLWKLWGASIKAPLKEEATNLFQGPIGTGQGLFTVITKNRNLCAIDTRSFFVPENSVPAPSLFKERLKNGFFDFFDGMVEPSSIRFTVAPRTLIADELPVVDLEQVAKNLVILLPTYHLGLTQSPAMGKIAALHLLNQLGVSKELPLSLVAYRADRFKNEMVDQNIFDH